MRFLILYIILNSLFFLPRYLLERKSSTFFPYKGFLRGPVKERIQFLINRFNYDIFRVSIDFFVLTVVFVAFSRSASEVVWHWSFWAGFSLMLIYQLYYHAFENIYKVEPLFYRDFLLLKTGAQIFFREFNKTNVFISLAVVGGFVGIFFLIGIYLETAAELQLNNWWIAVAIVAGFMSLYSLFTYNYKAFGKIVFPSQFQSLVRNIRLSLQTRSMLGKVDFEKLKNHRPYADLNLTTRPNIYFIPIESYGRILYDQPELIEDYNQLMTDLQGQLKENAWSCATNLSLAPITGGASWVSYSSALFGFDIKDQGVYLTLLNNPKMHQYEHFMRWLKNMGYTNYRIAPIAGFKGMQIPWDNYSSFYAIDEWIKYEDMDYTGKLWGFGPCPPDQYSLSYAKNYITAKQDEPFCLFFITQNSHSPFTSPNEVVEDWKALSDNSQEDTGSSSIFVQPKLTDYSNSIKYQMNYLSDFIIRQGNEDDVFILFGDHQPPTFPKAGDRLETPVHIISKNERFVKSFADYGYESGLLKNSEEGKMKHEAVFSQLVRSLVESYGKKGEELPPYQPDGVNWLNF